MPNKVGVCNKCFQIRELTWHHVHPQRHFGKKNNDSRVLLCWDCHQAIERILKGVDKLPRQTYLAIYRDWILGNQPLVINGRRRNEATG